MNLKSQSWSIIVFCYNEVGTVAKVIKKAVNTLQTMGIEETEVLVVDDGSTDGSRAEIENEVQKYDNVRYIFHEQNKGIGHALRTGYFNVKFDNICAVPADGQFDIEELIPFASLQSNTFISFFRKENTSYSLFRNALSKVNKMINQLLNGFNLKDVNWVKIYRKDDILSLNLQIESSLVESEICAKLLKRGKKVIEVESKYLQRVSGVSKGSSFKIVVQAMKDTIYLSKVLFNFK